MLEAGLAIKDIAKFFSGMTGTHTLFFDFDFLCIGVYLVIDLS